MNTQIRRLTKAMVPTASLLAACAVTYSPPVETLNTVVYKGRITDRMLIDADPGIPQKPVALGPYGPGAIAIALSSLNATGKRPAHYIYDVSAKTSGREVVRVAFLADLPVGTCVEVLSEASNPNAFAYNYGYAILRPADGCYAAP